MPPDSPSKDKRLGVRIGRYQVLSHIAAGGMGVVYKARDVKDGREVALKVMAPEMAARPNMLARFQQEARSAGKLAHENIVAIYEIGEEHGTHFLALEYVEGIDLQQYISKKGTLPPEEALLLVTQAVRALDHASQKGIVHRDIKPANFLITQKGGRPLVKLADMGLAREVNDDEFRLTRDGTTVGTIDYLSPEQARDSRSADVRSDIYSLGCTWYHMLSGSPPFAEGSLTERLFKHMQDEPPDLRPHNPGISAEMMNVLWRMLAKQPEDRYQTAAELLDDLTELTRPPQPVRPLRQEGMPTERDIVAPTRQDVPAPPPPPPSRPRKKERPKRPPESGKADADSGALALSPAQRQAAAGQFQRAEQVLAHDNYEYAFRLLLAACKLDPGSLLYRRGLRRAQMDYYGNNGHGGRLAWLTTLLTKARLKAARRAGNYARVLEHGEQVLTRNPWDLGTQLDMADAADELGLVNLAVWLLEQAQKTHAESVRLSRALARLYEKRGDLAEAVAMWEVVCKAVPDDTEAHNKTKDLAANETIAKSLQGVAQHRYGRRAGRSDQ